MKRRCYATILTVLVLAGCGGDKAQLTILCGSSMQEPMKILVEKFKQETGVNAELTLGGCETLLPDLELGAPADLFIGHTPFEDLLAEKDLRQDELVMLGAIQPAVAVKKGNPKNIATFDDLTKEGIKLGRPDARFSTCGEFFDAYAKEQGKLEAIEKSTSYTSRSHQELATNLEITDLDVCVMWGFVAAMHHDVFDIIDIGVKFPSAPVFATIVKAPQSQDLATKFLEFMKSDAALKTFTDLGYGTGGKRQAAAEPTTLRLYCAAGVQKPIDELTKLFTKQNTGVDFEIIYQGSGALLAQIAINKTGDLYVAGDDVYMERAREQGLLGEYTRMAVFTPVLAVPSANPQAIQSFGDLAKPGTRLGLGDETATAVGKTARILLAALPEWDAIQKNIVVNTGTVNELATQVSIGSLDAAILWNATATQFGERIVVVAQGTVEHQVGVPIAALKFTQAPELANAFTALATTPEAAAIFKNHGFEVPEQEAA